MRDGVYHVEEGRPETKSEGDHRVLMVLVSYHHKNTEKVAEAFARVLDARIKSPQQVSPEELSEYDMIGFGSGIYDGMHHLALMAFVDGLPVGPRKRAFIFSTSAIVNESKKVQDHSALREKLRSKGFEIVDEFACKGFNTNSFLRYFGGMNKGRPSPEDLDHAEKFARKLKAEDMNRPFPLVQAAPTKDMVGL